jgi:hypothetical protein
MSILTNEFLAMTYPDEYYKNVIEPAKLGKGPVPSKMQMLSKAQPFKAVSLPFREMMNPGSIGAFRSSGTPMASRAVGLGKTALGVPFCLAALTGQGIGYGVDQLAQALNTPEEYEAMKEAAKAQRGFGYFDDVDISQPPGTNVGIVSNLRDLFDSSAMANEPTNVVSRQDLTTDFDFNTAKALENRAALDRAGLMALDDAGLDMGPIIDEFSQKAKPGFNRQFAKQLGTTALGLITGNPFVGLITRGLGALAGKGGLTGIRGGVDLRGDTGFDTFRRSTSLADFLQRRRDKKAREAAAKRGEVKELQSRIDKGDFGGSSDGGGGFSGEGGYGSSAERGGALHG